jgi:hypothetical protein
MRGSRRIRPMSGTAVPTARCADSAVSDAATSFHRGRWADSSSARAGGAGSTRTWPGAICSRCAAVSRLWSPCCLCGCWSADVELAGRPAPRAAVRPGSALRRYGRCGGHRTASRRSGVDAQVKPCTPARLDHPVALSGTGTPCAGRSGTGTPCAGWQSAQTRPVGRVIWIPRPESGPRVDVRRHAMPARNPLRSCVPPRQWPAAARPHRRRRHWPTAR